MAKKITIDPVTRIEGHLAISIEVEADRVVEAFSAGEMFRGFEVILQGRDPLDAQQITQRICGVCPVSHGTASVLAQDHAYQITPPDNGRLLRNLMLAANYIQSHIIHFYHLSALDFIDIAAITTYPGNDPALRELKHWVQSQLSSQVIYPAAPFLPRYEGTYAASAALIIVAIKHYLDAFDMRKRAHEMVAIFGGKVPHVASLIPGGSTERVTAHKIVSFAAKLQKLQRFIDQAYLPDVLAVATAFPEYFKLGQGCGNFLSYGVFPESSKASDTFLPSGVMRGGSLEDFDPRHVTEDVRHSLFSSQSGLPPATGQTTPAPDKQGAYSWLKAPRYNGEVMEVGPLARLLIAFHRGQPEVRGALNHVLTTLDRPATDLISVMGRHAARAVECKLVADRAAAWVEELVPGEPTFTDFAPPRVDAPEEASGGTPHRIDRRSMVFHPTP